VPAISGDRVLFSIDAQVAMKPPPCRSAAGLSRALIAVRGPRRGGALIQHKASNEFEWTARPKPKAKCQRQRPAHLIRPSISLPKGGGAIRGIGEKFAANPVSGTGSMSVPIACTPGPVSVRSFP